MGRLGPHAILLERETPEPAPCLGTGWAPHGLGPKHQCSADGLPFVSPRNPELPFAGPNAANQCPPMDFKRVLTHGPAGSRFTFRWLQRSDPSLLCGRLWALTIDSHSPFCPCWCCWCLRHGWERGGRVGRLAPHVILLESETPEPAPCLGAGWTPPWLGPNHQRSADGLPVVSPRTPELPFAGPNAANQCPPMDFKRVLTPRACWVQFHVSMAWEN